jgi:hypothetical protein
MDGIEQRTALKMDGIEQRTALLIENAILKSFKNGKKRSYKGKGKK